MSTGTFAGGSLDTSRPLDESSLPCKYAPAYQLQLASPCSFATFSTKGTLAASGTEDGAIRIYNVERALRWRAEKVQPVLCSISTHSSRINDATFHPEGALFLSCSSDKSMRLFDLSYGSTAKSVQTIKDVYAINSVQFHPSGYYALAATEHPIIRMYDTETWRCYASEHAQDHHTAPVTKLTYKLDGRQYASTCRAGAVKLWDTVSGRCVQSFDMLHDGAQGVSVEYSSSGDYLLATGFEVPVQLIDLRTNKVLQKYHGPHNNRFPCPATFGKNEDTVLWVDGNNNAIVTWGTRSGSVLGRLEKMHSKPIQGMSYTPTHGGMLMTCGMDRAVRFFTHDAA